VTHWLCRSVVIGPSRLEFYFFFFSLPETSLSVYKHKRWRRRYNPFFFGGAMLQLSAIQILTQNATSCTTARGPITRHRSQYLLSPTYGSQPTCIRSKVLVEYLAYVEKAPVLLYSLLSSNSLWRKIEIQVTGSLKWAGVAVQHLTVYSQCVLYYRLLHIQIFRVFVCERVYSVY